ncbi:response regulator [Luteimonas sp. Y-2-2-4F]|nr:response regulator [Luteimonas sp. Y-2-2-4F]
MSGDRGRPRAPAAGLARCLLLGLLALIACAGPAWALHPDNLRLRQIGVAEGLPSNRVNALVQDPRGYLWIATSDGLARYDGTGLEILREEDGLPDNFVWSLAWSADDRLWIGTRRGGVAVYDPARARFEVYDRATLPGLGSNDIWSLDAQAPGEVWIGTSDAGLYRLREGGALERHAPARDDARSLPHAGITHLRRGPDGALWVGTTAGVARWTGRDFERVADARLPLSIAFDRAGALWVGLQEGAALLGADGRLAQVPARFAEPGLRPLQLLLHDVRGGLWVDVQAGLGRIEQGEVHEVPLYSPVAQGPVRPQWTGGLEDREGGVWLISHSHGLWHQPADWSLFSILDAQPGDPHGLANSHVRGIAPAADGRMWLVGSGGALESLAPDTRQARTHLRDVAGGLVLDSVFEDARGRVWIGWKRGLARFDPAGGELRTWREPDDIGSPAYGSVIRMAENAQGLWLLFDNAIVQQRDGDGRVLAEYRQGAHGLEPGELAQDLAIGPDGAPWLATARGALHLREGRWRPVPGAPQAACTALEADAGEVVLAGPGRVALASWDNGRLQVRQELDAGSGLPTVSFSGIERDRTGTLWLSSARGVWRVDPAAGAVRAYGIADGLPSQEFAFPLVARPDDGRLFVGSPDGLVAFDPLQLVPSVRAPELVVERVGLLGSAAPLRRLSDAPFRIRHDDRDLQVVVRLPSFRNPAAHVYAFRLLGHDPDWIETGATGERVFSQLAPGRYTLQARVRNADGVWSAPRTIKFEVAPPWWWALPARLLFLALAGLAALWLGWVYRARLRRRHAWQLAEHKRELAEHASQAKTRFLATLGHEVRTPMTGVLGMSELLLGTRLDAEQRRYTESIRDAGEHLLRLVNDALDLARIEAGKLRLDPQPFDLYELLREASGLMAPVAAQRGLAFRERIAVTLPRWVLGDAVRVRQILLNLLGNAIKFTDHGFVELQVDRLEEDGVRFLVGDSGPGLNREQRERLFRRFEQADGARTSARYGGSGLGLAICQELAAEMGGRIEVDSAPGQGTRFTVELPLPEVEPSQRSAAPAHARAPGTLFLLLVEDDPTVAEVIVGLLQAQGHRVLHVAHGLSALVSLATAEVDAALLDLDLPGIDGLALARQMRAQGFARPLIAITARADADAEPLAMQAGFDGFLRKPLTGAILADALARIGPVQAPRAAESGPP